MILPPFPFPLLIHKISRYQNFSETQKGSTTILFGTLIQKIFDGKSWYSLPSPSPFLSIKFHETRTFLKHRRVPLRNVLVRCDKINSTENCYTPSFALKKEVSCGIDVCRKLLKTRFKTVSFLTVRKSWSKYLYLREKFAGASRTSCLYNQRKCDYVYPKWQFEWTSSKKLFNNWIAMSVSIQLRMLFWLENLPGFWEQTIEFTEVRFWLVVFVPGRNLLFIICGWTFENHFLNNSFWILKFSTSELTICFRNIFLLSISLVL